MGGGDTGLSMFDPSAESGWVVNVMSWSLYPRKRELVSIVQEVGWVSGPVWTGPENFTPTGV